MLPPDEQIGEGVRQLQRYQNTHEQLFHYNQFMIVTSNDRAKAGTIGAKSTALWGMERPVSEDSRRTWSFSNTTGYF
ncbi:hypothetical protein GCM10020331_034190 [Ectobacillus funiculus]